MSARKPSSDTPASCPFGNFAAAVERTPQVPPADVLWIAVQATRLETALRSIPATETVDVIVPLVNGMDTSRYSRSR
ncbi:MAG TPA: hypothetical protein VE083_13450 [Terriglobales bacterium]|nr:hypothetical protein [Terriglobales bacterium]